MSFASSTVSEVLEDKSTYQKVVVCGSLERRGDYFVAKHLNDLHTEVDIGLVIHDGESRVGRLAAKWATEQKIPQVIFPHRWSGKETDRNKRFLATKPDIAVVFSGRQGSPDMVHQANKAKISLLTPS